MEDDIIKLISKTINFKEVKLATKSRTKDPTAQLLVIDKNKNNVQTDILHNIGDYLESGDLIVVNQSATIPASFHGTIVRTNEPIEIRLAAWEGLEFTNGYEWKAITFGRGDWTEKTEDRKEVNDLIEGDIVTFTFTVATEEFFNVAFKKILTGTTLTGIKIGW